MPSRSSAVAARHQADLFPARPDPLGPAAHAVPAAEAPPPPPDFLARLRAELGATLARAEAAEALPWPDLTAATLAELRFRGILHWLPQGEAEALRARFDAAMHRLYAAIGEA